MGREVVGGGAVGQRWHTVEPIIDAAISILGCEGGRESVDNASSSPKCTNSVIGYGGGRPAIRITALLARRVDLLLLMRCDRIEGVTTCVVFTQSQGGSL